eukprot:CAMPEP_0197592558 /NCGR_PEP_ID=MMETSP1326-20131121/15156_1 /TAXON_ID=1155430 /ORGANISM="Genus nov. species nov., Strain RCC2288" /LENGTH=466 /DNA_ID=CAMNT_0043158269 /DNA_START=69 /DNA_END=1469 /DNA_ORIENTATION=-
MAADQVGMYDGLLAAAGVPRMYLRTNATSIDMVGGYIPESATVMHVEEVAPPKETMKVVILSGGFSAQLTHDIIVDTIATKLNKKSTDAKAGAGGDRKSLGSHTHVLRGGHGTEFVNPGFVKISDTTHLEHLFIMLRKSERLCLERDLFIVGSDAVRTVLDDWCGESDVQFPVEHVVYNGLTPETREQQSDVSDLALAIDHFGLAACKCPVVVISADTIFHQDYNFARILEHAYVRGKDVFCTYELTPGQVECDPNGAPVCKMLGDPKASMGKIKSVELNQLVNSGRVLAPVMVMHRTSVERVRGFVEDAGGARDLFAMIKEIVETKVDAGDVCYAVDVGFGRFDCITLENLRFSEEFTMFYVAQKLVLNKLARTQDTDSSLDFKTSASGRGDGSKDMNQVQGYGDMLPQMEAAVRTFVRGHFQDRTAALSGKMHALTPSNFYQTEYTRNTPVLTPRPTPLGRTLG